MRGLLIAAASALFFSACWETPEPAPHPRSLAAAEVALRTGDLDALRHSLRIDDGVAARARELAQRLDPEAWQIAMGVHGREVNLAAAAKAMQAGDDAAFRDAAGLRDQSLRADALQGGLSVDIKRSNARNYYERGHAPLDLLTGCSFPATSGGAQALHYVLYGTMNDRRFMARVGLGPEGAIALSARRDLAAVTPKLPADAPRGADATALASLPLDFLHDRRFTGAEAWQLERDGTLRHVQLHRDGGDWVLIEESSRTLEQRLQAERDRRLTYIYRRAAEFQRNAGRAPRGEHELSVKPAEYVDPVAASGRLGWADHDPQPAKGLKLAGTDTVAAQATEPDREGRTRFIDETGTLGWK